MTPPSATAAAIQDSGADDDRSAAHGPRGGVGPSSELEALYRSGQAQLTRAMTRRTGDRDSASDLVQDAFLRLVRMPEGVGLLVRPRAYLRQIAVNLSKDLGRKRAAQTAALHVVADETTLPSFDPHAQLESRDMLRRVEAAMLRLPEKTREIFLAHRVEGLTYAEIAARMGLSVKGVEKHMSKALVRLDRLVARG